MKGDISILLTHRHEIFTERAPLLLLAHTGQVRTTPTGLVSERRSQFLITSAGDSTSQRATGGMRVVFTSCHFNPGGPSPDPWGTKGLNEADACLRGSNKAESSLIGSRGREHCLPKLTRTLVGKRRLDPAG